MKRINILDLETSNKIAAGEVVERPASVVKELVENSIDANGKNIQIHITDGGQKSIKIVDDGDGIFPEDIEKAFLPHATSKISTLQDIYKINTMGFRGEALASIASVSKVLLKSRTKDYDYGKEVYIEGGNKHYIKDTPLNIGTSIEVNDIFYNVPARAKFLKSTQREAAAINDIINRLALANSNISFSLTNNEKKSLTTYGTGNLVDAVRCVYGKTIVDNIIYFEGHNDVASVYGYIGNSEISRGSRNNQSIFVNKRYIKNKLINVAVENAFKSFLTINKYPFYVLFLDIYPEFIDVNVHPTKSEIKFTEERSIYKLVFDSVHNAIKEDLKKSHYDIFDKNIENYEDSSDDSNKVTNETFKSNKESSLLTEKRVEVQLPIDLNSSYSYKEKEDTFITKNETNLEIPNDNLSTMKFNNYYELKETGENKFPNLATLKQMPDKGPKFGELSVIGQFNNTYILAQGGEDLYIIDQHAAHEKILFERYIHEIKQGGVVSQILITPEVLELSSEDYLYYVENIEVFRKTGFNIDFFGENTISIREVPIILGKPEVKTLFMQIIDNLKSMGTGNTTEVKYNNIATLACKSAVKASHNLSLEEMKALIEDLRYIEDPFNCPHGRPTIIKVTLKELEKKFKRIM